MLTRRKFLGCLLGVPLALAGCTAPEGGATADHWALAWDRWESYGLSGSGSYFVRRVVEQLERHGLALVWKVTNDSGRLLHAEVLDAARVTPPRPGVFPEEHYLVEPWDDRVTVAVPARQVEVIDAGGN